MIAQKSNIQNDAQSIASDVVLLLVRITLCILVDNQASNPIDIVASVLKLCLKSKNVAFFLSKFVADLEQEDAFASLAELVIRAFFENLVHAALYDAISDGVTGKNISLFLAEVSRQSVSITVKVADVILPCIQSENYDIRKAVITCLAEMILQRYTTSSLTSKKGPNATST
ncbi:unnamed protein product [Phytomonas sp. Hart1]|nr:unnamed protein product [Phytomonas sp. Hart1]|eukprot:CCW70121.1 unnamed protein product [Phytomonas sp. isolate Hart1]